MLNVVYYQPWSLMHHWHRELDQVFNGPMSGSEPVAGDGATWTPAVDVQEESTRFLVRADIPGVAATDIEITADDGVLTIQGQRKANEPVASNSFESTERVAGPFMRRFTLPDVTQTAGITANYVNGVLDIVIPKVLRPEAKRISVTAN